MQKQAEFPFNNGPHMPGMGPRGPLNAPTVGISGTGGGMWDVIKKRFAGLTTGTGTAGGARPTPKIPMKRPLGTGTPEGWGNWFAGGGAQKTPPQLPSLPLPLPEGAALPDNANQLGASTGYNAGVGTRLGATAGGVMGALVGMGRGNTMEGLGRGLVRGGATGAGIFGGSALGQALGNSIDPQYGNLGAALGGAAGGLLGYGGSGMLLGDPESERRKKEEGMKVAADEAPPQSDRAARKAYYDKLFPPSPPVPQFGPSQAELDAYREAAHKAFQAGTPEPADPWKLWADKEEAAGRMLYRRESGWSAGKRLPVRQSGRLYDAWKASQKDAPDAVRMTQDQDMLDPGAPYSRWLQSRAKSDATLRAIPSSATVAAVRGVGATATPRGPVIDAVDSIAAPAQPSMRDLATNTGLGLGAGALLGGAAGAALGGGRGAIQGGATGAGLLGGGAAGHAIGSSIDPQYGGLGAVLGGAAGGLLGYGGSGILLGDPEEDKKKQQAA